MKKLFKKIHNVSIYILSFTASFIGIALNFYLARTLGAEEFGKIQYLVALATTISQILLFGLNSFLIREAKNIEQKGELANKCFSLFLMVIIFFIPIVFFVLSNYLTYTSTSTVLAVSVLLVSILMGFNAIVTSYFHGSGKYHLTIIFENLIPKALMLGLAIVFTVLGKTGIFGDNYLIFYIVIYSLVAIPFCIKLFKKINFNFTRAEIASIFFFFGVTITYSLGNNLTKVIQGGLYKNNVALAIISLSISFISFVNVFTSVLNNMVKPIFAKLKRENDLDGILDLYRFDTRMNSYVSIPLYLFFIFNAPKFLGLFGDDYLAYTNILTIIACANLVNELTGPNGTMLAMTGKEKWELVNGFVYFGVYIAGVFAFSFDKVYGLCYALLVAQVVVNVLKYIEVYMIYKKAPLNLKTILTLLIVVVVNFGAIFALRYINVAIWLWMIIGVSTGIALVLLNVFVISLYRKDEFKTFLSLRV